jgi:hypothetical protein
MSRKRTMKPGWLDERRLFFTLRHLWRSTTLWILLSFSLAWYMCFRYCAIASARDPTTYFFDEKEGYQRSYSIEREKQAYAYLGNLNHTDSSGSPHSENPSMCIGVTTVARPSKEQYVRGTVGSLLEGLSDAERAKIYLILFIAHTDPSVHPIYHEPWLKAVSNRVLTYDVYNTNLAQLRLFEENYHPRNKSMYDYGYLLSNCLKTGAEWITVVEDDVIAREGWYNLAMSSLRKIQNQVEDVNWLYMRMFYTEALLGLEQRRMAAVSRLVLSPVDGLAICAYRITCPLATSATTYLQFSCRCHLLLLSTRLYQPLFYGRPRDHATSACWRQTNVTLWVLLARLYLSPKDYATSN